MYFITAQGNFSNQNRANGHIPGIRVEAARGGAGDGDVNRNIRKMLYIPDIFVARKGQQVYGGEVRIYGH